MFTLQNVPKNIGSTVERSISILKEKDKIHFEQTISGGKKHLHAPRMTTTSIVGMVAFAGDYPTIAGL
jgi:hypothetical protein